MSTLASVDKWYRCTGCGYIARSQPYRPRVWDDEIDDGAWGWDDCPQCGARGECWQWCGGLGRDERQAILERARD